MSAPVVTRQPPLCARRAVRTARTVLGALVALVVVGVFGLGTIAEVVDARRALTDGPRTDAEVVDITRRRGTPDLALVRFEAEGRTHQTEVDLIGVDDAPNVGGTLEIAYLPEDPGLTATAVDQDDWSLIVTKIVLAVGISVVGLFAGWKIAGR